MAGRAGDGVDERVHFLESISAAEGEAEAGAGAFGREADGEQDVGRRDGAARTGRAARDGEAFEVERDDHGLAVDAFETNIRGIGDAAVPRAVDAGVGDAGENAVFEEIAQGAQAVRLLVETVGDGDGGAAEGHGAGDVFGAGAKAMLVAASEKERIDGRVLFDEERSDALGRVDLVTADGIEIDAEIVDASGQLAERLDAVGVEKGAGLVCESGDFADGLDGAGFVIDVHHGDERGIGAESAGDVGGIDHTVGGDGDIGDRCTFALQLRAGLKDTRVLDTRRDDVVAGGEAVAKGAEEREVIGLGAAAGENDFLRIAMEERGHLAAGHLQALPGDLAAIMDTGSVAVHFACDGKERLEDLRRGRSGSVVIEIRTQHGGYF